ncbi:cytospin-A [Aplochiton taeniatus]
MSPGSPLSVTSPPTWRERDSGICQSPLQALGAADSPGEGEGLAEECRIALGLSASQDGEMSPADLLKRLMAEVSSLRDTLQTERTEWVQFQADLQVAVAVADRLRAEAEEELTALRTAHRDTERELAASQQRQKEAEGQLVTLRGQLRESRQLVTTRPQTQAPNSVQTLDHERPKADTKAPDNPDRSLRGREREMCRLRRGGSGEGMERRSQNEETKNVLVEAPMTEPKGVAKRYLRNLTNEERSREEVRGTNGTRRAATTERSRSLSRLPVSSDSPAVQNGTSHSKAAENTESISTYLSQPRGRRSLERQDSWSTTHAGKQEETLNKYNSTLSELPPTNRSQDGFNLLLRRHGGSKRNSLLRWCQSRTQGYQNIEITNFSSSWADGLAFCAVYHTYLPSLIPYCTLSPESKRENLSLALKTGENIGITQSLTVDEMLRAGGPDWQRVLGYVESMYRHFEM